MLDESSFMDSQFQMPLQSETYQILRSINLNNSQSSLKTPNSKPLITSFEQSDTFKELQFSISSNGNSNTQNNLLKQHKSKSSEKKHPNKPPHNHLISPVQEICQSKVSEFQSFPLEVREMNNKLIMLMQENDKLSHINECLIMEQLRRENHVKFGSSDIVKENQRVQMDQQKEQRNLEIIERQRDQINNERMNIQNIIQEYQNQEQELRLTNINLNESLECSYSNIVLFKIEIERLNMVHQEDERDLQQQIKEKSCWQSKLQQILTEHEKLNQIFQERLREADKQNKVIIQQKEKMNQMEISYQAQIYQLLNKNQNEQRIETQLTMRNKENLQQNDQIIKQVKHLEEDLINKNNKVNELNKRIKTQDQKWKEKCQEFKQQTKEYYQGKLNIEVTHRDQSIDDIQFTLQQQAIIIQNLKSQQELYVQENENLKEMLAETRSLQSLQVNPKRSTSSNNLSTCLDTRSFDSKYQMIQQNKNFNNQIFKRCTEIIHQS